MRGSIRYSTLCLNGNGCLHTILGSGMHTRHMPITFCMFGVSNIHHLVSNTHHPVSNIRTFSPVMFSRVLYTGAALLELFLVEVHTFKSWVSGFIFRFVSFSFLYCVSLHTGHAVLYTLVFAGWRSAIHASKNSCLLIALSYIFLHTLRSLIPAA